MTGALVFRTAMISHMGLVRRLNEDSVLAKPEIGLWAVADGMGGHGGGDIASHAVVEALELLAPQASASNLLGEFERCIVRVNGQLRDLSRARGRLVMGTTLVALMIHGGQFACVWCGTAGSIFAETASFGRSHGIIPKCRSSSIWACSTKSKRGAGRGAMW